MEYLPLLEILTLVGFCVTLGGTRDLPGSLRLSALGIINDEVSMKKINNRKMISVRDDMLN